MTSASSVDQLSAGECYERLWTYFSANRPFAQRKLGQGSDPETALRLLAHLPKPADATDADRDVLFVDVLSGWFEALYTQKDDHGVALQDYARQGLRRHPNGLHDDACAASCRTSSLYRWSFSHRSQKQ